MLLLSFFLTATRICASCACLIKAVFHFAFMGADALPRQRLILTAAPSQQPQEYTEVKSCPNSARWPLQRKDKVTTTCLTLGTQVREPPGQTVPRPPRQ